MTQLALIEGPPPAAEHLSQWFTPTWLAERLVASVHALAQPGQHVRVLEPSAGSGALVDAWLGFHTWGPKVSPHRTDTHVTACELDPRWVGHLRERYAGEDRVRVLNGDFMATAFDGPRFDACIMNPPYESGLACAFLRRCMDLSERVAGIFQTSILQGVTNVSEVWSDDAWRWTVSLLERRPRFSGSEGTAQRDFCVVRGVRRDLSALRGSKDDRGNHVEWWR